MKTLKVLLMMAFLAIMISSCSETIEPIRNPEQMTTVSLYNLEKDTVPVLIADDIIYVFNEDGYLQYKVKSYDMADSIGLMFLIALSFGLIFLLLSLID